MIRMVGEVAEWRLVCRLLKTSPLPREPRQATKALSIAYEFAANLVRRGNSAEAIPLLETLLPRILKAASLRPESRASLVAAAVRKLGQAHLRAGRFTEAKELLNQALTHPHFPEAANTRTDLALAEAGFRSLDSLLPKEDQAANENTIQAVESQAAQFQKAVTEEGRATNARFVLGLIALHRRRATEAEQHFATALSGMLLKEEAYQTAWLVDWVRFFLAIIVAEQCQPARFYEVKALVETAMTSAAVFPLGLWAQLLRATALYDDQSLAEAIIQHLLSKRGDAAYALLKESGLLFTNTVLRTAYRSWIDTTQMAPIHRAEKLRTLLDAALKEHSTAEATELLDALEGVAKRDGDQIPHFLTLINARRSDLLAVWDEHDLDNAEASLLERSARFSECAEILQRMFYRCRVEGDWEEVEDLLEQLDHLKLPSLDLGSLRAQVEHLRPPTPAQLPAKTPLYSVKVLYVGGDETQSRYEQAIQRTLAQGHPGLQATLYFPGWDSNWNVHLANLLRLLPSHHVVVINRFVRTQLGRKLRAACGSTIPWRACTGHGRESLLRAIVTAAEWMASRSNNAPHE